MKNVLTFTMIAGKGRSCPNDCPICISKMTPEYNVANVNWKSFEESIPVAINHNAKVALITSKGSPELTPAQVSGYLLRLKNYSFDRIELQTDGFTMSRDKSFLYDEILWMWRDLGLQVISLSIFHYDSIKNKEMFRPKKGLVKLGKLIRKLQVLGFRIRLSCIPMKGYIDSVEELKNLIDYCKEKEIFQLTVRQAGIPDNQDEHEVAQYIRKNALSFQDQSMIDMYDYVKENGILCDKLPHGARVYEVNNQNICWTDCITEPEGKDDVRYLIFYPQGILTTSWTNVQGGRIL